MMPAMMAPPMESSPPRMTTASAFSPISDSGGETPETPPEQDARDHSHHTGDDPHERIDHGGSDAQTAGDLLILGGGPHGQPHLREAEYDDEDDHDDARDDQSQQGRRRNRNIARFAG